MPSKILTAAAGLVALSTMVAAFPQAAYTNTTVAPTSNSTSGSSSGFNTTNSALDESYFCPELSGSVILSPNSVEFLLGCSTNHFGTVIEIVANSTLFRRQAVAPASIQDCLTACDTISTCVGAAFNTDIRSCTLYSEVGAAFTDATIDFAIRVNSAAATTVPAGGTLTSTVYSTTVQTISSCAPTVTNCPLASGAVVTAVVPVTSTDYICPTATVIPASPVACACAYSASTAVVYSSTTNAAGSPTISAVSTAVIAVPSPTGTAYATTTVAGNTAVSPAAGATSTAATTAGGAGASTATNSAGSPTYTGAASNIKAGMGLIAGVAGFAFML